MECDCGKNLTEADDILYVGICGECFWAKFPTGKMMKPPQHTRNQWKRIKQQRRKHVTWLKHLAVLLKEKAARGDLPRIRANMELPEA